MFDYRVLLVTIPLLPLLAAILTAILGPRMLREKSHWLTIAALLGSFLCSLVLLFKVYVDVHRVDDAAQPFAHVETFWTWATVEHALEPAPAGTSGAFQVDVTLRADGLTATMLCMVTFIATLVAIYSCGYMHGDRSYWRFFTYLSLFAFSMAMLVSVSNFVLLFVFWEGVGVCSYLLIGFWYEKPEAAAAGKKAFLVNRVGDFGFALALFLIWTTYGSLNYHDTLSVDGTSQVGVLGEARLSGQQEFAPGVAGLAIPLLLLLGACGKSAQLPLHVWLPDAMEGPTPVSALIHAATMVTAGVYMVARCSPLFMVAPDAQLIVACVGGVTALVAGVIAITQNDLKRVLAYSTISQLGYMFLGLGTGTAAGIVAALFHLFTHAFFKALLFLGAGSVMHGMGHVIDIRRFGGLRTIMPITCVTFLIGCLALAGIPPLAGFWSKDAILGAVHDRMHEAAAVLEAQDLRSSSLAGHNADSHDEGHNAAATADSALATLTAEQVRFHYLTYRRLYWMGLVAAFLTALYTFRAFFLTFCGPTLIPEEAGPHAHESPQMMWVPLAVLSVFAVLAGVAMQYHGHPDGFQGVLLSTPSLGYAAVAATAQPGGFHLEVAATSTLAALAGLGLAAFLYLGDAREIGWLTYLLDFGWLRQTAQLQWLKDVGQQPPLATLQRVCDRVGIGWLSRGIGFALLVLVGVVLSPLLVGYYLSPYKLSQHKFYVDELYLATIVKPLQALAAACYGIDRWLIDGLVNQTGIRVTSIGNRLRGLQNGLIPFYGLAMVLAACVFAACGILWAGTH